MEQARKARNESQAEHKPFASEPGFGVEQATNQLDLAFHRPDQACYNQPIAT
jgi:hypothetical protein